MAKAEAITFKEFLERYNTEEACWKELYHLRFPEGFICPHCGCRECFPICSRKTFQCKHCRRQISVTAGTVMHRTHLPLTVWFWGIYLCVNDKRGTFAVQLSSMLGICYESAWYLLARIRRAMGQRDKKYTLAEIVEMDDGYVGGPKHGGKRGRGTTKIPILAALSKSNSGIPLFIRMQVVDDLKTETIQKFTDEFLNQGTRVECDGLHSYSGLQGVTCNSKKFDVASNHLKWLHRTIGNLKAFLNGTYHGRCAHLQAYLDEYCFRFNRRKAKNQLFPRLLRAVATSCTLLS